MSQNPISRRVLTVLVAIAAVLLVSLAVLLATGAILGKMGDVAGQTVLNAVALAAGIVWAIDLICLVFSLALTALAECDDEEGGNAHISEDEEKE